MLSERQFPHALEKGPGWWEVWETAFWSHHEAQVWPCGEDGASDIIVEIHVLIDKVHILFMRQEVGVQTRAHQ